jgi:hypothetical protein
LALGFQPVIPDANGALLSDCGINFSGI